MKRRSTSSEPAGARQRRLRVAAEAARLLAEQGGDPAVARRKAAERLGFRDPASLPTGDEIRDALAAHRRLFAPAGDDGQLQRQREAALAAMDFFAEFSPRLAGAVLDGSADARSVIELHLHADDPDAVARRLIERAIPAVQRPRRLRLERGPAQEFAAWHFEADGLPFELVVLPRRAERQGPLDPLDDAPMARANRGALARLLAG